MCGRHVCCLLLDRLPQVLYLPPGLDLRLPSLLRLRPRCLDHRHRCLGHRHRRVRLPLTLELRIPRLLGIRDRIITRALRHHHGGRLTLASSLDLPPRFTLGVTSLFRGVPRRLRRGYGLIAFRMCSCHALRRITLSFLSLLRRRLRLALRFLSCMAGLGLGPSCQSSLFDRHLARRFCLCQLCRQLHEGCGRLLCERVRRLRARRLALSSLGLPHLCLSSLLHCCICIPSRFGLGMPCEHHLRVRICDGFVAFRECLQSRRLPLLRQSACLGCLFERLSLRLPRPIRLRHRHLHLSDGEAAFGLRLGDGRLRRQCLRGLPLSSLGHAPLGLVCLTPGLELSLTRSLGPRNSLRFRLARRRHSLTSLLARLLCQKVSHRGSLGALLRLRCFRCRRVRLLPRACELGFCRVRLGDCRLGVCHCRLLRGLCLTSCSRLPSRFFALSLCRRLRLLCLCLCHLERQLAVTPASLPANRHITHGRGQRTMASIDLGEEIL